MSRFDIETNRMNTYSMKWDVKDNELPMWVADMDFETAPEIVEALKKRVDHRIFGYTDIPDEWKQSIIDWWDRRHNLIISSEQLLFVSGVVPAISSIVRKMTTVGENVLVMSPTYNIFYNSIYNNGRNVIENKLEYKDYKYSINFEQLEIDLSNPQTTLLLLCNPHNPIGKIWSKKELACIGKLANKYNVLVVSDEIHADITNVGSNYVPFASVSAECRDNSITCIAPTKAFNLAGLQTAAMIISNPFIRHKVNRGINTDEVAEPNVFAITATIAAFNQGEQWLEELRAYITSNKHLLRERLSNNIPELIAVGEDATYLEWLDCSQLTNDSLELADFIRKHTGLYLSNGSQYRGNGTNFLRINLACSKSRLQDGLNRLETGIKLYKEHKEKNEN